MLKTYAGSVSHSVRRIEARVAANAATSAMQNQASCRFQATATYGLLDVGLAGRVDGRDAERGEQERDRDQRPVGHEPTDHSPSAIGGRIGVALR
jgi:hypothetical protein